MIRKRLPVWLIFSAALVTVVTSTLEVQGSQSQSRASKPMRRPAPPAKVGTQIAGSFADATGHSAQSHLVYAANAGVWWLFTLTSAADSAGGSNHIVKAYRSSGSDLATAVWTAASDSPGASASRPASRRTASWAAAVRSASPTSTTRRMTSSMRRSRSPPTARTASPATSAPADGHRHHWERGTTKSKARPPGRCRAPSRSASRTASSFTPAARRCSRKSTRMPAGRRTPTPVPPGRQASHRWSSSTTACSTSATRSRSPRFRGETMLAVYDNGRAHRAGARRTSATSARTRTAAGPASSSAASSEAMATSSAPPHRSIRTTGRWCR